MKIIKKLLGLDKVEANIKVAEQMLAEAEAKQKLAEEAAVAAQQREELSKLSPKDRATRKKEPWVGVLETHVNKDNVRNGFFELDWNEQFVLKLRQEGYGVDGDKDEEVVDRWFRELCANVVVDGDFGGTVTTGSLDPSSIQKNL
jgi:hypothetical protein